MTVALMLTQSVFVGTELGFNAHDFADMLRHAIAEHSYFFKKNRLMQFVNYSLERYW